jgi:hypothetical protein
MNGLDPFIEGSWIAGERNDAEALPRRLLNRLAKRQEKERLG